MMNYGMVKPSGGQLAGITPTGLDDSHMGERVSIIPREGFHVDSRHDPDAKAVQS